MSDSQFNYEGYNEYKTYLLQLGSDNSKSRSVLMANLARAVREDITERQWQLIQMYYVEQMTMPDIAEELGIGVSTVSRTIKRGRERLQRCLRYGARELLNSVNDDENFL